MPSRLIRSPRAEERREAALRWLAAHDVATPLLVVGASFDAASDLIRHVAQQRGAVFGWQRTTLARLAATLATPVLAERAVVPLGGLAREAIAQRVLGGLRDRGALGRLAPIAEGPGLARAIASVLTELRQADAAPDALDREAPELAALARAYEAELGAGGLADREAILRIATHRARDADEEDPMLALPTLLLDVAIESPVERDFVAALASRAPDLFATLPAGDATSALHLGAALGAEIEAASVPAASDSALARLQTHLFEDSAPDAAESGADVVVLSAPGESRECVEIARRCLDFAAEGVRFDEMAVLLRSPDEYRAHLEEAFARAEVPAHFARGAVAPDPTGRAFCALLACAAEQLSARRFAEYLSLGEVPDAAATGEPPAPMPRADRWVAPDEELIGEAVADALGAVRAVPVATDVAPSQPVVDGQLRAPRRWERLLVDAAVIGGRARWERRLDGLARSLALELSAFDDPAGPEPQRLARTHSDLAALRGFALPLLDELAALPARASWGAWSDALSALATRALRHPERVLAVLAEIAPMAPLTDVSLDDIQRSLSMRLLQVSVPPPKNRHGKVFVAPTDAARGLAFDVVFVPGLAERLFPRKIAEEPILLDAVRERLGIGLATNATRVARERLALRLAVGAARNRVVLSYPRLDLDESRPRVPSFYALEALRAAEGRLPGFDELAKRAETLADARVGWPAPRRPEDAIDAAEHDLALLEALLLRDPETTKGTARYLLDANEHLARALRFRVRRWWKRWTWADGLVAPTEAGRDAIFARAREAIAAHALTARSFSPTALQNYAACPYRFFLQAIHRFAPREVPEPIEEMDPLQRGSLVHEVQFALFQQLAAAQALPITPANLADARARLDALLDAAAAEKYDAWAPAIDRVWQDGIESVRADLREWLRRASEDTSGFVPWKFELAFGLAGRQDADPDSTPDALPLANGIQLRGSIDLVERRADGTLRATDHKTGKQRFGRDAIVQGGAALQPVLYALALEQRFEGATVEGGRLYYCTSAGGFAERVVPLDAEARQAASVLAEAIDEALTQPMLPAAPADGACAWCDYRVVCGPYEEFRTARKPREELAGLQRVRELR